ncbi:MFS transporter [Galactobacter sp.]|uniref:MFS transporter n=1 Tax=Galactobacter sp. TaxID=2676125 RepID=UPI0025C24797|nr:MFS transporter [Galactobacter sp.]
MRSARLGISATFLVCGFGMATWVVHIPSIVDHVDTDDGGLGLLLLVMGVASIIAMQLGGLLAARLGSKALCLMGAPLMAASLVIVGLMPNVWWLGVALVVLGAGQSLLDIGMNDQAVRVERGYGRPIMGSVHAFYSIGGALGAALGGPLQHLGWPIVASMTLMAALTLLGQVLVMRTLLPGVDSTGATGAMPVVAVATGAIPVVMPDAAASGSAGRDHTSSGGTAPFGAKAPSVLRMGLILAFLAASFFLAEGTVSDWSGRHAVAELAIDPAAASLGYGVFSVGMTIMRFAIDPISHRIGAMNVVRFGAMTAALGVLLVILVPSHPVSVVGWGIYGLGLAGIVPQLFSAAGSLVKGPKAPVVLSRVVGAGYAGLLVGPAVIGWLSGLVGLTGAFWLPFCLCLLGVFLTLALPPDKAEPVSSR